VSDQRKVAVKATIRPGTFSGDRFWSFEAWGESYGGVAPASWCRDDESLVFGVEVDRSEIYVDVALAVCQGATETFRIPAALVVPRPASREAEAAESARLRAENGALRARLETTVDALRQARDACHEASFHACDRWGTAVGKADRALAAALAPMPEASRRG
jgi:hypothetical protein